jgi:hypothetical protein
LEIPMRGMTFSSPLGVDRNSSCPVMPKLNYNQLCA